MKEVTDLFIDIVEGIDNSIELKYVELINNQTHFHVCDTKWARKGKLIRGYDSAVPQISYGMNIVDVIEDELIIVDGNQYVDVLSLYSPFYISGTKISTNNEWNKRDKNLMNKTPLCWLYQNYNETIYGDDASLERTITLNIAFIDETNPMYQKNKDHIDNVVVPMKKLVQYFIKSIDKKPIYKKLKQHNLKTYSRFGVETDSGVVQNILDADLGGVVLSITLDKFKEPCKC
jgi:hypothetical protein